MQLIEERLRSLILQSLAGDAAAYRMFWLGPRLLRW